jgi:enoyl-CoA hydratase/carnithine racemase
MTQLLIEDTIGAVRVLTLNRPDKRNALNTPLHDAMLGAFGRADADPGVRCVLLAGNGKSFCAGADLDEHRASSSLSAGQSRARIEQMARLQMAVSHLGKPVLAAVHGTVLGAGAGLAISADITVMADDARIGYPEVPHGMVPTLMFPTLVRQVGRRAAFELLFLGEFIGAERALALGLVNESVPAAGLMPRALAIAARFEGMDPGTLRTAKKLFYGMADLPLREGMRAGVEATLEAV